MEAYARIRGDFSAVESTTFRFPAKDAIQSEWDALVDLDFAGKYRRDAKTSYATKSNRLIPFEVFDTVSDLLANLNAKSEEEALKASY